MKYIINLLICAFMKKNHLFFASLLLCMLAVFSFSFVGCSDNADELDYPEGAILPQGDAAKPFKATRLKGTLKYDDIEQKWIIEPEVKNIICLNNYSKCTYFITNMTDEYESLAGEVVYSGIVKLLYVIGSENTVTTESYFSIELSEMSSAQPNSRSLSNDSFTF